MSFHITLTFPDEWDELLAQAQVETNTRSKHAVLYDIIKTSPSIYLAWEKLGKKPLKPLPHWGGHAKSHKKNADL